MNQNNQMQLTQMLSNQSNQNAQMPSSKKPTVNTAHGEGAQPQPPSGSSDSTDAGIRAFTQEAPEANEMRLAACDALYPGIAFFFFGAMVMLSIRFLYDILIDFMHS